jgi:hypothetical protein
MFAAYCLPCMLCAMFQSLPSLHVSCLLCVVRLLQALPGLVRRACCVLLGTAVRTRVLSAVRAVWYVSGTAVSCPPCVLCGFRHCRPYTCLVCRACCYQTLPSLRGQQEKSLYPIGGV